jgi:hypothetical protein
MQPIRCIWMRDTLAVHRLTYAHLVDAGKREIPVQVARVPGNRRQLPPGLEIASVGRFHNEVAASQSRPAAVLESDRANPG